MNKTEITAGLAKTPGYQYVKQIGNQLFVSGQVPNNATGEIVGKGDPFRQVKKCLNNLQIILNVHGFQKKDIQQLTIYVTGGRKNLGLAWDAILEYFQHDVPPATLLGLETLGYENQLVEIDLTIIKES